jgi:hypothetical protein
MQRFEKCGREWVSLSNLLVFWEESQMSFTLRQICLVAEKIQPVVEDLEAVFGLQVCYIDQGVGVFGLENRLLPIGSNFLEIVSPTRENTAAGRYLKRRGGDGGYMIITQTDDAETQADCRTRAEKLGVRVAWERQNQTVHYLQLHPGDMGGAFFSVDWDTKNEHHGHWMPAGGTGWEKAVHTDVVSELKAAELQSPDPASLAERWSAVAGMPLRKEPGQPLEMPLNNAVIRFVESTDGRGEGLGALDLTVKDLPRLLKSADRRGLKVSESQVMICGVRFNLVQ